MTSETLFPDLVPTALPASSAPVRLEDIERLARSYQVLVLAKPNVYGPSRDRPDPWATWEAALADGQSYLCGSSVSREAFLRVYRRPLLDWMVPAYAWARQNPDRVLTLFSRHFSWHVYQRGEYVSFKLPFHDSGGEKEYISRDGVSRIKVNDD
jgi:hypothetical protein